MSSKPVGSMAMPESGVASRVQAGQGSGARGGPGTMRPEPATTLVGVGSGGGWVGWGLRKET